MARPLRRLLTRWFVLVTAGLALAAATVAPARALPAPPAPSTPLTPPAPPLPVSGQVEVVKVTGLIDPINADLVEHAVRQARARRPHVDVLVLQVNSTGGLLNPSRLAHLVSALRSSPVPVAVWVGGSGRPRALGQAFELVRSAAFVGVGPSARIGEGATVMSGTRALAQGMVQVATPTIGDFIVGLDGRSLADGLPLHLAAVVTTQGQPRRQLRAGEDVTFSQLTIWPRLLHGVASPDLAFVMLLIGLSLAVFEFFTVGVGIAAASGVGFGILAAYGLGVLPTRPWAVALVGLGILGYAIDLQAAAPRAWTVIGTGALVAGALELYQGFAVAPWVIVIMVVLVALGMVAGMPPMVRTRFATPTIGRGSMIGAVGVASSDVDPDGTVEINGAPWRARTNRATPISTGTAVRVVSIDGLVLEVEPGQAVPGSAPGGARRGNASC